MSGGVDSSLAAALLVEAGYDVVGVAMRLWDGGATESGCCSLDDFLDARRVADQLGIPFYVMDFTAEFRARVVEDFVGEYRRGRTPNPCARCNQFVKFDALWTRVQTLGAAWIATGHYARRVDGANGPELHRGRDPDKDQSYFLFALPPAVLRHALFPVGELTKAEVRAAAARRGLAVAGKPDSQEICFAPRGTHATFVEGCAPAEPPRRGVVVDATGTVLARHAGIHHFTIGQRRGLGVSQGGPPRYVAAIEAESGVVRVGSRDDVLSDAAVAAGATWLGAPPAVGARVCVKVRSRFAPEPAVVTAVGADTFTVVAARPLPAVTPGQAAVLYAGERVVGGGWIVRGVRRAALAEADAVPPAGAAAHEA
jgi:tRNA-specific 2-thiouridylase